METRVPLGRRRKQQEPVDPFPTQQNGPSQEVTTKTIRKQHGIVRSWADPTKRKQIARNYPNTTDVKLHRSKIIQPLVDFGQEFFGYPAEHKSMDGASAVARLRTRVIGGTTLAVWSAFSYSAVPYTPDIIPATPTDVIGAGIKALGQQADRGGSSPSAEAASSGSDDETDASSTTVQPPATTQPEQLPVGDGTVAPPVETIAAVTGTTPTTEVISAPPGLTPLQISGGETFTHTFAADQTAFQAARLYCPEDQVPQDVMVEHLYGDWVALNDGPGSFETNQAFADFAEAGLQRDFYVCP